MIFFRKSNSIKNISWSTIALFLILGTCIWYQLNAKRWNKEAIIQWDVLSYYAYLPATFIYDDITLEFIDDNRDIYSRWFWPSESPTKKYVIKTSMGMSLLYSPFFLIAHLIAEPLGFEKTGFSPPYHALISFGALVYVIIGLIFLRRLLLRYYSDFSVAFSLIVITIGTNFWWYATIDAGYSHIFSFSLFAVYLYLLDSWLEKGGFINSVLIGILTGLIVLVRPSNILVGLFFLLWRVGNLNDLKVRFNLLFSRWNYLLIAILMAVLVWVPQMIYWRMQAGSFLFNSYGEEKFYFLSPNIINGLFSYRKGLFIYTPAMILAFLGFIFLFRRSKELFIPILGFILLNIYVVFSWWCWWYGGSYGSRALIESFVFLSFPLAAFFQWSFSKGIFLKISTVIVALILIAHSIFQTFQYYHGAVHWDAMSKQAYWDSFGRKRPSANFSGYLVKPNYDAAFRNQPENEDD